KSDGRAAVKAAKALDVSPTYVKKAKAVAKADPKLADDVKAGKVKLAEAERRINISGDPVPVNCSGEPEPVPDSVYPVAIENALRQFRRDFVKRIDPVAAMAARMDGRTRGNIRRDARAIREWLDALIAAEMAAS